MEPITLTLGDFVFSNLEIPSKIPIGGTQALVIQNLVGGKRSIDAMGAVPIPLEWSGCFFGANALNRALYVDDMRLKGKPLELKWSSFKYMVVISKFTADYEFEARLPYHITCEIVTDNTKPVKALKVTDYDTVMKQLVTEVDFLLENMKTDVALFDLYDPNDLLMSTNELLAKQKAEIISKRTSYKARLVGGLLQSINGLAKATTAQIVAVKGAIADVQNQITRQLASMNNFLGNITTLGGVLPNNALSINVANFSQTITKVNNQTQLMNLKYLFDKQNRIIANVKPASASTTAVKGANNIFALPTTQVVQQASLFALASMYYGNAMKWTLIAQANNLTDPYVSAPMTLIIPIDGSSTGGALNV